MASFLWCASLSVAALVAAVALGWARLLRSVCHHVSAGPPPQPVFLNGSCDDQRVKTVQQEFCDDGTGRGSSSFERDGFSVVRGLFTEEEASLAVQFFEEQFAPDPPSYLYSSRVIASLHDLPSALVSKVREYFDRAGREFGEDFALMQFVEFVAVSPGDDYHSRPHRWPWHQDSEYLVEGNLGIRINVVKESPEDANVGYIPFGALRACAPEFAELAVDRCCGVFRDRDKRPQAFEALPASLHSAQFYRADDLHRSAKIYAEQNLQSLACLPQASVGDGVLVRRDAIHTTAPFNTTRLIIAFKVGPRRQVVRKTSLLQGGLGKWRYLRSQGWAPVAEVLGLLSTLGADEIQYGEVVEKYGRCFEKDLTHGATGGALRSPKGCPLSLSLWSYMWFATRFWELRLELRLWMIEQEISACK